MVGRRRFLTIASTATIVGFAGCSQDDEYPETLTSNDDLVDTPTETTIDITLYMDDVVAAEHGHEDSLHPLTMIQKTTGVAFSTIPDDDQTLNLNFHLYEKPIPVDNLRSDEYNWATTNWKQYIDKNIPQSQQGTDTNLLLTSLESSDMQQTDSSSAGQALRPCQQCNGAEKTTAITFKADEFSQIGNQHLHQMRKFNRPEDILTTAVHEIGHTVGLTHEMGNVVEWVKHESHLEVSPMLTSYVLGNSPYTDQYNDFGEYIPDTGLVNANSSPYFNPNISLEKLRTA